MTLWVKSKFILFRMREIVIETIHFYFKMVECCCNLNENNYKMIFDEKVENYQLKNNIMKKIMTDIEIVIVFYLAIFN